MQAFPNVHKTVEEFWEDATSFYFDTALSGHPSVIELLLKFARPDHIFYGSDYPYAGNGAIETFTKELDSTLMSEEMRQSISFTNALKLFPRIKV